MKTKKQLNKVIVLLTFTFFFIYLIIDYYYYLDLCSNFIFTVGITTRIENGTRGSRYLYYEYQLNNKLFEGCFGRRNKAQLNQKYLVKVSKKNPSRSIICLDYLIKDAELGKILNNLDTVDFSFWYFLHNCKSKQLK